jgi:hypothetical protein
MTEALILDVLFTFSTPLNPSECLKYKTRKIGKTSALLCPIYAILPIAVTRLQGGNP